MRPSRGYVVIAAAMLIVLAVALAVLRGRDEEPGTASPTATTEAATTSATTGAATTEAAMTDTEKPAATTTTPPTGTSEPATTAPAPLRPYSLQRTRRCLQDAGFAVSKVRSADPRLRALGDLAQRTSLEARRGGKTLGLAFGDTRLLASLLRVPNDPYRLEVRRNALLMYRPSARDSATVLRGCLRT